MKNPKIAVVSNASKGTREENVPPPHANTPYVSFPHIRIDVSAGWLEIFELFFRTMPSDSSMEFVQVSHLDGPVGSALLDDQGVYCTVGSCSGGIGQKRADYRSGRIECNAGSLVAIAAKKSRCGSTWGCS